MEEKIPKYEIGNVVQLKSGGLNMTINKVIKTNSFSNPYKQQFYGYYKCCYTDEVFKTIKCLELHEEALILISKNDAS
ncbi:MAG TPA: DUF2158 domain-containing protein [Chitinophagales bacterium]|nr:DUF2158 domain-containing protein [Chitinophagales bacterium]